jgi:diguanylate cyclase (GGDEF)-like protein
VHLHLDLRTVTLLAGMMGCLMAVLMRSLKHNYPPTIRGLREWTYLPVLHFAAGTLIGLRDHLPLLISVTLGNASMLGAMMITLEGTQRFYNQPSWRRPLLVSWLVLLPPLALMRDPEWIVQRIGVISGLMGMLFSLMLWQISRQDRQSLPARFLLGVLGLLIAAMSLRSSTIWIGDVRGSLFEGSLIQAIYLVSLAFGALLLPLGLILLASERLRFEILQLATHDPLTGLLSRRALFEAAEELLQDCRRRGRSLTLLILDLDHFKQINDTHGHLVGDQVLIEFSRRLQATLPHPAVLGRYGGEEFIAVLPGVSRATARELASRLLDTPPRDPALPVCTASIGLRHITPDDPEPALGIEDLIRHADAALYRAKGLGRHRVEEADQGASSS